MTYTAFFTATVRLIFLFNLFWSLGKGAPAQVNPWRATTLEWTISLPPPVDSFGGHHPAVFRGTCEYSVPGTPEDYILQNDLTPVPAES